MDASALADLQDELHWLEWAGRRCKCRRQCCNADRGCIYQQRADELRTILQSYIDSGNVND